MLGYSYLSGGGEVQVGSSAGAAEQRREEEALVSAVRERFLERHQRGEDEVSQDVETEHDLIFFFSKCPGWWGWD